jgi:shikimate dehydrogenase
MTSPALQEVVAVLASPAAGNPSQYLFERALAAAGLDWRMITCDVAPSRLTAAISGAAALGFRGCLVSGPLRALALGLVATTSPAATFARGVSLLERSAEGFSGHMTAGRGVIEAVRGHADPAGRTVLVLGAGPTGRAVALEMALAGASGILVAAENAEQAAALAEDLTAMNTAPAELLPWAATIEVPERAGIVVRATAAATLLAGLRAEVVYADVAAVADPPPEAVAAGCCLVTGLEVRAVQAAIEFQALTGIEPDVELLREALDEYLS